MALHVQSLMLYAVFAVICRFDLQHFCGLSSDGASVMLGSRGGVSKLIKNQVPFLVANHCIAHRLALAAGQAANEMAYLKGYS